MNSLIIYVHKGRRNLFIRSNNEELFVNVLDRYLKEICY